MDENARRPWYSFRWTVLLWIAIPFAWIAFIDHLAAWINSDR